MANRSNPAVESFEPLADYILCKPLPRGETAGGIAIPEMAEESTRPCTVITVGPGEVPHGAQPPFTRVPMDVVAGDRVYLTASHYAAPLPLRLGGEEYLLCRQKCIVARQRRDAEGNLPSELETVQADTFNQFAVESY